MKMQMGHKLFSLTFISALIIGCAYSALISRIDPPINRQRVGVHFSSVFDVPSTKEQSASIGDELFVIRRYKIGEREIITAKSALYPFPAGAKWTGTHRFDDKDGKQYTVYTTPKFYNGSIGVILDENENLATRNPLIQVIGGKKGRRWPVDGKGKFIQDSVETLEAWGVRYSGQRSTDYIFEIVDKRNANVTEIIQSIHVSEGDFLKGFIIRGVLVKGSSADRHGVIKYSVKEMRIPQ